MNKTELLEWLREEERQWEGVLDQVGRARLEQAMVTDQWSMKDLVAHLAGWNRRLVARLGAAQRGEAEPPLPWPAQLQTDDEVNAWIYEANHGRAASDVLQDAQQIFQDLLAVIERLPDDVRIETIHGDSGRDYHMVWVDEQRYPAGEFFDHLHDDHEPDIRALLQERS